MGAKASTSNVTTYNVTIIICTKKKTTLKTINTTPTEQEFIAFINPVKRLTNKQFDKFLKIVNANDIDTFSIIFEFTLRKYRSPFMLAFMKDLVEIFKSFEVNVKKLKYEFNGYYITFPEMVDALKPSIIEPADYGEQRVIFRMKADYTRYRLKLNNYKNFYAYATREFISIDICFTEMADAKIINSNIGLAVRYASADKYSEINLDGRITAYHIRLLTLILPKHRRVFCGYDGGDMENGELCVLSVYGFQVKSSDNMAVIFTGRGEVFKLFAFKTKDKEDLNTKISEKLDSYFQEHDDWKSMLASFVEDFFAE